MEAKAAKEANFPYLALKSYFSKVLLQQCQPNF